jgi:hypothetical protein
MLSLAGCSSKGQDNASQVQASLVGLAGSQTTEPMTSDSSLGSLLAGSTDSTTAVPSTPAVASTTAPAKAIPTQAAAPPVRNAPLAPAHTSPAVLPPPPAAAAPQNPAPAPPTTTPPPAAPSNCDSAYPDSCLRDGIGDYDCAGGSGNGPNYVSGPIRVLPPDPFKLDADGDGVGCES